MNKNPVEQLKKIIISEVFTDGSKQRIVTQEGESSRWLFDVRRVIMRPEVIKQVGELFAERFKDHKSYQIGCLEAAGIPIATGLSYYLYTRGQVVNAFFIRKSRKKSGLLNMVEGEVNDTSIILVDDVMNSGNSFIRQVEVLESLGKKVTAVFSILRFRDISYYEYFHQKNIKIVSLFTLDDFSKWLPVANLLVKEQLPVPQPYVIDWCFRSEGANYFYVVPKSAPALDAERVYFGSDSGFFWSLNQADGSIAWSFKVGLHAKGKSIFSSPLVVRDTVYFGAYDGNVYALNTKTGEKRWIYMEADWVGSSPCFVSKYGLVCVGVEFGLFSKQGGVVALDAKTGEKRWEFVTDKYVHASPTYSSKYNLVVCGANNGLLVALDAKTGEKRWEFVTGGEIKAAAAFSKDESRVYIGSFDGQVYALDTKTGKQIFIFKTEAAIYSTPLVHNDFVYASSLDKKLYCFDAKTGEKRWEFAAAGRMFASPEVVAGEILIGANDGRMYSLDAKTGVLKAQFQAVERITNRVAYNKDTKKLFLPTFANEIYRLSK